MFGEKADQTLLRQLLNTAEYPNIEYRLTELVLKEPPKPGESVFLFDSKGELVLGGRTNALALPVSLSPMANHKLKLSGSTSLKLSDFGITPPKANGDGWWVEVSDEVRASFVWVLERARPGVN
jgi:polyisoprenoid-binding protein YceI